MITDKLEVSENGAWASYGYGKFYPVISSTIASYVYNPSCADGFGDLIIKFKNGGFYKYIDIPSNVYVEWTESVSKGKFLAANIKDKFVTEKLVLPCIVPPHENPQLDMFELTSELGWTEEEEEEFLIITESTLKSM